MDIKKLKKVALSASAGEWSHYCGRCNTNSICLDGKIDAVVHWSGFDAAGTKKSQTKKNAAFIAAFNPSVALEMIQKIENMPTHITFEMPDRDQYCGEDYDQVYNQFAQSLSDAGIFLVDQNGNKFVLG